eukprot:10660985-Ditylum_brightwellii.AAC.1
MSIDYLLEGTNSKTWLQSTTNEVRCLSAGISNRVTGSNTITYIPKDVVTPSKWAVYANMVCDYRPLTSEKHCF